MTGKYPIRYGGQTGVVSTATSTNHWHCHTRHTTVHACRHCDSVEDQRCRLLNQMISCNAVQLALK